MPGPAVRPCPESRQHALFRRTPAWAEPSAATSNRRGEGTAEPRCAAALTAPRRATPLARPARVSASASAARNASGSTQTGTPDSIRT